jgi:hypothetical protein
MVDVLSKNDPSQASYQTRYFEVLLLKRPGLFILCILNFFFVDVANTLLGKQIFTQYDQVLICCVGVMCYMLY